jgi:hypothetical protein
VDPNQLRDAGLALFAGRLILDAQPPIDDATLAAVAERCAGPLPEPLIALWRTAFGGRLDYDLRADVDGQDVPVSFTELFYPDSGGYHDLWGWIDHDGGSHLTHLPIGGFEYLDRVYVGTTAGPDHGAVFYWRQGLPPGWELRTGDRTARLAADLPALFDQLMLEQDPWNTDEDETGATMRDAIDALDDRAVAAELRDLVRASVLDWRGALERGTLTAHRVLRRLAMEHAAADDDVALLTRLVALGCDPAEEVRSGLTPIDVALRDSSRSAARWLLDRHVPVDNTLRSAAHTIDRDLAEQLLDRGASVNLCAVSLALNNDDVEVLSLMSRAVPPGEDLRGLGPRLRMLAAQASEPRRASVLTELADRFG